MNICCLSFLFCRGEKPPVIQCYCSRPSTPGRRSVHILGFPVRTSQRIPFQISIDKGIQVSVHNRLDIAGFIAAAQILDHGIRLENIGADLGTPGDILDLAANLTRFRLILLDLEHIQLGLQHLHGLILILEL